MNSLHRILFFSLFLIIISCNKNKETNSDFVIYSVNPQKENVELFWKNEKGQPLKNIQNLRTYINSKNQDLKFALNGGMLIENNIPKGLYIENYKTLHPIDTLNGEGNFYLKPNGVFYITKSNESIIVPTKNFQPNSTIKFATQSGPLFINEGKINSLFQPNSNNLNVRNGVGILKNGNPVFVMSKKKINFYNFASFFKKLGCENALCLDGFVSKAYFSKEKWIQEDGDFGVMIGITAEK